MTIRNNITRKGISILLILTLFTTGFLIAPNAYGANMQLSQETYYHLDMGVQMVYNQGCDWGKTNIYGSTMTAATPEVTFNSDISVIDVYPLVSSKGSSFDFNGSTSSHNIPSNLGSGEFAYQQYYEPHRTSTMTVNSFSGSGTNVRFTYTAKLSSREPLEVVQYGRNGKDEQIWKLFGGQAALEADQPRIADAIAVALEAGRMGTAGSNRLYLIFCPNVIEYKKWVEAGDITADLTLPAAAEPGEPYEIADNSKISANIYVKEGILEKQGKDGMWKPVAIWKGDSGKKGQNTGGKINQSEAEEGEITYRLKVTANSGQTDTAVKRITIARKYKIDGQAILSIPERTFEGHTAEAIDHSLFNVDGIEYGAARMYSEKLASNKFTTSTADSTNKRTSDTTADITFNKKGNYNVLLSVTTKNNQNLTDRKNIEVLKTPTIIANLGGKQKENRKQVLNISVAANPKYPLTDLWVEVEKKGGTEKVRLVHNLQTAGESASSGGIKLSSAGAKNVLVNSALIKTRAIEDKGSNQKFTNIELQFLTKNHEQMDMTYRIFAKDTRGNTDLATKDFTVNPDNPPVANIYTPATHIRNQGTNVADIKVEDKTITDGDQLERTWYVRGNAAEKWTPILGLSNVQDTSFGSMKSFVYSKDTGVGMAEFRLNVKDLWTEETLAEYISEKDYLRSQAEAITDVKNVAPIVTIDPINTKTVSLLMLARTKDEKTLLLNKEKEISLKLLEKGIDVDTDVKQMKMTPSELSGIIQPSSVFDVNRSYGYGVDDTFLEKNWYLTDGDTLYTVDGTWSLNTGITYAKYYNVSAPYTINAYDISANQVGSTENANQADMVSTGGIKWSITINADMVGSDNIRAMAGIAKDDEDKYLFFRAADRTLIYEKDQGAYLGKVNIVFGEDNYSGNDRIFTLKSDGVYSVSTKNGHVTKLYSGDVCTKGSYCNQEGYSKRLDNQIHFISSVNNRLYRCTLDPKTEKIKMNELNTSVISYNNSYNVIGFGTDGKVAITQDNKKRAYVFGKDNLEIGKFEGWAVDREHDVLPVYKSDGTFDYISSLHNTYARGSSNYYYGIVALVYPIKVGELPITYSYERQVGDYGTDGSGTDAGKAMYAVQHNDEILVNTGDWATSIADGSSLSSYYFTCFSQIVFNTKTRSVKRDAGGVGAYGGTFNKGGTVCEYGKVTDDYITSAYSWGHAGYSYGETASEQCLKVSRLPQTMDEIMGRAIGKFAINGQIAGLDETAVMLYDNNQGRFNGEFKMSTNKIISSNASFINTEDVDGGIRGSNGESTNNGSGAGYGEKILSSIKDIGGKTASFLFDDTLQNSLAQFFGGNTKISNGIKVATDQNKKESSISKTYTLKPGTKYFYQYDAKGNLANVDTTDQNQANQDTEKGRKLDGKLWLKFDGMTEVTSGSSLTENRYDVIGIEKENFTAPSGVNNYFKLDKNRISQGRFTGGTLNVGNDRGENYTMSDSSTITFNVPTSTTAILTFDYEISAQDNMPDEVYVDINNNRWDRTIATGKNPTTYTHPYFLPAGKNTITLAAKGYGTRPIPTWIFIDNLKVVYLKSEKISKEKVVAYSNKEGKEFTFTAPQDGIYDVDLYGPSSSKNGGIVKGQVDLKKGDILKTTLGDGAFQSSGAHDGANGVNGSGYKDNGPYKSTVLLNDTLLMVAGGSGSDGNPGTGDGTYIRVDEIAPNVTYYICPYGRHQSAYRYCRYHESYCRDGGYAMCICGQPQAKHNHLLYNGTGGKGGESGKGGNPEVTKGAQGKAGTVDGWSGDSYSRQHINQGGKGGKGGDGGASYIDKTRCTKSQIIAGGSSSISKVVIKYQLQKTTEEAIEKDESAASKTAADGWTRYSGSFKSPQEIVSYRGQQMDYVLETPSEKKSTYLSYNADDPDNKSLAISIPTSKTAINAGVRIWSGPYSSGNNDYNVNWNFGGKIYRCYADASYGNYHRQIPGNFRVSLGNLNGNYHMTESARAYSGTSGEFAKVDMAVVDEVFVPVSRGAYFLNPEIGELFFLNETYKGRGTLTVTGSDNWYMKNFKLYYIENGRKVYVEEGSMTPEKAGTWMGKDGTVSFIKTVQGITKPEDAPLVYKKGQLVAYNISYYDYENDPSRKGYWVYAHTPFNDGAHEKATIIYDENGNISTVAGISVNDIRKTGTTNNGNVGIGEAITNDTATNKVNGSTDIAVDIDKALAFIKKKNLALDTPIDRFYTDGKYTVYHWQEDNTTRKDIPKGKDGYPIGNPAYDKESNVEQITFYVEGGAQAPWITGIGTITKATYDAKNGNGQKEKIQSEDINEGAEYRIKVGIDDNEKDVLSLTTEVYKEKKLIYTYKKKNIEADINGRYPYIYTDNIPKKAECGKYDVVCTVRDKNGTGIGSYEFTVASLGKITAMVHHTEDWEKNRTAYNVYHFKNPINTKSEFSTYAAEKNPRKRGTNVFWAGERFMLEAQVAGNPKKVTCKIDGYSYNTTMTSTGKKNGDNETIYRGSIWDSSMINNWGRRLPQEITFKFMAAYGDGNVKEYDVKIIVDNTSDYWRIHRIL